MQAIADKSPINCPPSRRRRRRRKRRKENHSYSILLARTTQNKTFDRSHLFSIEEFSGFTMPFFLSTFKNNTSSRFLNLNLETHTKRNSHKMLARYGRLMDGT